MSSPCEAAASVTAARLRSEAIRTRSQRSAAVTMARVPFVVDIASVGVGTLEVLLRRVAQIEPVDHDAEPLAAERDRRRVGAQRTRIVHLGGHRTRRSRTQAPGKSWTCADDVDDGTRRGRCGLVRSARDVNSHAATLAVDGRRPQIYRHPARETLVSCSEGGRPICGDCMTFAPVGIRCPEHASVGAPATRPGRTARRRVAASPPAGAGTMVSSRSTCWCRVSVVRGVGLRRTAGNVPPARASARQQMSSCPTRAFSPTGEWWRTSTVMLLHAKLIHLCTRHALADHGLGSPRAGAMGICRCLMRYSASGIAGLGWGDRLRSPNLATRSALRRHRRHPGRAARARVPGHRHPRRTGRWASSRSTLRSRSLPWYPHRRLISAACPAGLFGMHALVLICLAQRRTRARRPRQASCSPASALAYARVRGDAEHSQRASPAPSEPPIVRFADAATRPAPPLRRLTRLPPSRVRITAVTPSHREQLDAHKRLDARVEIVLLPGAPVLGADADPPGRPGSPERRTATTASAG